MNDQQQTAINYWNQGFNVKVTAVPGAGKSRVLLEACKSYSEGIVIILAYNHDLCEETKNKILEQGLEDQVICLTFHGLATYCIMPAYDDTALFDAIEGVESGEIPVQNKLQVSAILIDEAQDFRPSFLRLLHLVLQTKNDVQYMVVGDPNQMLYTYDPEDPADIKYIQTPETFYISSREWKTVEFFKTHRLTPPIASFVSKIFNIHLESAKEDQIENHQPVSLMSINLWKSGPLIYQLIDNVDVKKVVILVPKKKNNGPLKATINHLSVKGKKIYLHGFDGQDTRIKNKKLCIGTWHSSKGTEKEMVIVLGVSNDSENNPCFVALTRSLRKLVIIQDEDNPHMNMMKALSSMSENEVFMCNKTKQLLAHPIKPKEKYNFKMENALTYSLDNLRLSGTGRWIREHQDVENIIVNDHDMEENTDVVTLNNGIYEDVSDIYIFACSMAVEYERTGKVRLLEDIRTPQRILRDKQDEAILNGHHSRFISPNIPVQTLLGDDMIQVIKKYGTISIISPYEWCELACVARCWNDFHHTIRQLKPFDWFDIQKFEFGCDTLKNTLPMNAQFDIRVKRISEKYNTTMLHGRVHAACNDTGIYIIVWGDEINHNHRITASIKAALFENKTVAFIINIQNGNVQKLTLKYSNNFLNKILP